MARALRITFPGAFYHITSRGNERKAVFKSNRDREKFLEYLESATQRYDAVIHTYCLMDNHYHLLLETPVGNLPQIMRHINGAYTTYFNTKRMRSGHLFQGRYKAILVDVDEYVKELSRYIHLNPVRAKMVEKPEDYKWSSYRFFVGKEKVPPWLNTELIMGYFGSGKVERINKYSRFINSIVGRKHNNPLENVVSSTLLGSEGFISYIKKTFLSGMTPNKDIPVLKHLIPRATIQEISDAVNGAFGEDVQLARIIKIYLCREFSGEKLKDIGEHAGITESGVVHASNRIAGKIKANKNLRRQVERLVRDLKLSKFKT